MSLGDRDPVIFPTERGFQQTTVTALSGESGRVQVLQKEVLMPPSARIPPIHYIQFLWCHLGSISLISCLLPSYNRLANGRCQIFLVYKQGSQGTELSVEQRMRFTD